jgi:hypothetical protein
VPEQQAECGYIESQEEPICAEPAVVDGYCEHHNQPRFSVCTGCGGRANHLCRGMAQADRGALCGNCVHYPDDDSHGPFDEERHRQAMANIGAQTPPFDGEPAGGAPDLRGLRQDLSEALVLSLRRSGCTVSLDAASVALDDLGTTLLINTLTGMARASQKGP